jgi:hypothetical protein
MIAQSTHLKTDNIRLDDAEGSDFVSELSIDQFNPFDLGYGFAIGFQKVGMFGPDPSQKNADDVRPDIMTISFEKVSTFLNKDDKIESNVTSVESIELAPCRQDPLTGTSDFSTSITGDGFLCTKAKGQSDDTSTEEDLGISGGKGAFSPDS